MFGIFLKIWHKKDIILLINWIKKLQKAISQIIITINQKQQISMLVASGRILE